MPDKGLPDLRPRHFVSGFLFFSYDMRRRSISHSYGIIGTSCALDSHSPTAIPRDAIGIDEHAVIAVQLMNPDHLRGAPNRPACAIKPEGERSGTLSAKQPTKLTSPFLPLDAAIVSDAIPAFFIGRNDEGFWVARDVKGKIGGIFLFENSALSFARTKSRPKGCATIYQSERFELDLKNKGNPFIAQLGPLRRLKTARRSEIA